MSIHPELGWQLAQAKIEEARSGAERASAFRAAALERQVSGGPAGTRRTASKLLMLTRSRVRQRSLRATLRRTARN